MSKAGTTALIGGEQFEVSRERPFVFGRADADGVVGLDASDMGISAIAGAVEFSGGFWWLINHSRKRRLLLDDELGGQLQRLDCGQRFAISTSKVSVLVQGAIYTHKVEIAVPESDLARVESHVTTGTLIVGDLRLSERDKDVLVALFSGYLEAPPRRTMHPSTYHQAATLLGSPWTPVTVRKQIERLKDRATRNELYFDGPHGNYDLADYVMANGLLVPDDLKRLERES